MFTRDSKYKIFIIAAFCFFAFLLEIGHAEPDKKILVSGEGFEIDNFYIDALVSFYKSAGVITKKKEYIEQAIKIKLFSQEAKSKNLEPKQINIEKWDYDTSNPAVLALLEDMGLAEAYINDVISAYLIDDLVIESYYRSNPEQFRKDPLKEEDIMPLDDQLKETIRKRILATSKKRITLDVYSQLKDMYEIRKID